MAKRIVVSASPGKGLQFQGSGYYGAWSGTVAISQAGYSEMLAFEVGTQSIKAIFEFGIDDGGMASGEAVDYQVLMNGNIVMHKRIEYTGTGQRPSDLSTPFFIILPAMSKIIFQASTDHSTTSNAYVTLQARDV